MRCCVTIVLRRLCRTGVFRSDFREVLGMHIDGGAVPDVTKKNRRKSRKRKFRVSIRKIVLTA